MINLYMYFLNMINMEVKLDKRDKQILYLLGIDSRQSYSKIAKKIGTSKEVVNYRVKRLIDLGVIKSFYTLMDPSALGYITARFFVKFQHVTPAIEKEIIDYYKRRELTGWSLSRSGNYDFAGLFWGRNIRELNEMKKRILLKFRPYIKETLIGVYHKMHFLDRKYLVNTKEKKFHVSIGASEEEGLDSTDIKILKLLSSNARMPVINIANKIKENVNVVNYRLKKLKQNTIKAFMLMIDFSKLGYTWYKVLLTLDDYSAIDKIIAFCSNYPNITNMYEMLTGGEDLEIEGEFKSYAELKKFLNALMTNFSDVIRTYEYFTWTEEHKIIFMPAGVK